MSLLFNFQGASLPLSWGAALLLYQNLSPLSRTFSKVFSTFFFLYPSFFVLTTSLKVFRIISVLFDIVNCFSIFSQLKNPQILTIQSNNICTFWDFSNKKINIVILNTQTSKIQVIISTKKYFLFFSILIHNISMFYTLLKIDNTKKIVYNLLKNKGGTIWILTVKL